MSKVEYYAPNARKKTKLYALTISVQHHTEGGNHNH